MATPGRKKKDEADKVKLMQAYLYPAEVDKIIKKYGNATKALRALLTPKQRA
jgi:predicted RNA-binding protein YlqC (UPF0109 family)